MAELKILVPSHLVGPLQIYSEACLAQLLSNSFQFTQVQSSIVTNTATDSDVLDLGMVACDMLFVGSVGNYEK